MPALEFRRSKGWGRITMPGGSESMSCDLCRAEKKQYPGGGNRLVFCLGRPLFRLCRTCEKDFKAMWVEAGGGE